MTLPPLTHHQIIALVEPFARRGLQVDLTASDRAARCLRFKPIVHTGAPPPFTGMSEVYVLDNPVVGHDGGENSSTDVFRLSRAIKLTNGLTARLECSGQSASDLLARLHGVPPERMFDIARDGEVCAACSFVAEPEQSDTAQSALPVLTLMRADAICAGLTIAVVMPDVAGYPADITIKSTNAAGFAFDDDMLAVLGRAFGRLDAKADSWRSTMRVKRREPERSRSAEANITALLDHLAETIAAPPAAFHARFAARRWAVFARRLVPLATCLALLVAGVYAMRTPWVEGSALQMLIFNAPPLLMIAFFSMRELPRLEFPLIPHRRNANTWCRPDAGTENINADDDIATAKRDAA